MACYPPHVSKVVSYPTDFVGHAALMEQGSGGWQSVASQKLQRFWDESVLRIMEQASSVQYQYMTLDYILSKRTNGANPFKILEAIQSLGEQSKYELPLLLLKLPYHRFIETAYWFAISSAVKARAKGRCQVCNCNAGLEAHHRTYNRLGWEAIDGMSDLVALCHNCHGLFHGHLPTDPAFVLPEALIAPPLVKQIITGLREPKRGRILKHDPVLVPECDPIFLTAELITDCRANGSFTNATIRAFGVPVPLQSGWAKGLVGKSIPREQYRTAKEGKYHYGTSL